MYNYALQRGIRPAEVQQVEVLRGYGLAAKSSDHRILIGSEALMERDDVNLREARRAQRDRDFAGQTLAYMAVDGELVGLFAMVDRARPGMNQIVRTLRRHGIRTILLTGDPPQAAEVMARSAGMDEVLAGISPDQRAHEVSGTRGTEGILAIGGDPNRDGEMLQVGDISIAVTEAPPMGQLPGIWLMRGTFADLIPAIEVARHTRTVMYQSAALAMIWNVVMMGAGAIGVLGPHGPVIAGGAAALLSSIVAASSRRLLGRQPSVS